MDSEVYYFKNFEENVYELISKCLGVDETINVDAHFDFIVPNGVKNWNGRRKHTLKSNID